MRVAISFKSAEAAQKALGDMMRELDSGDASQVFEVEESDFGPADSVRVEIVNEANDEFTEPSAVVRRD